MRGQFNPEDGLRVCWLSPRNAEKHERHVHNIRPEIGLGRTPYRIFVTSYGGTAHSAFVRARDFRAWLNRVPGARVEMTRNYLNIRVGRVLVHASKS